MPHPLKAGGPPPVGGPARDYVPDHLYEGILGAAELPSREVNMVVLLVDGLPLALKGG